MIRIIGAGMAGLLAASMMRAREVEIYESKSQLPNNHHALLRFRTNAVADATGIPFRKVQVLKAVDGMAFSSTVRTNIMYSMKVLGKPSIRSIALADGGIGTRYIAPGDFINQLANSLRCKINFEKQITTPFFSHPIGEMPLPIISTIPMQHLASLLGYDWGAKPQFQHRNGYVIKADLNPQFDIYATLYFPNPEFPPYRASITGNQLIIETMEGAAPVDSHIVRDVLERFGFRGRPDFFYQGSIKTKQQTYAKIEEIDDNARKRFILWATEKHNVYSLGRFATWRPGLLLDDVVNDVRVIQRLIAGQGSYDHTLKGFR